MPFNNVSHTEAFMRQNFSHYPRYYMESDLSRRPEPVLFSATITRWNPAALSRAAEMTSLSYWNQVDALLCQDYCTKEGCETYLRSLLDNPGCGLFMPEASFMAWDEHRCLHGFVISCRISEAAGMIPQIAVVPSRQGLGLGNALIGRALAALKTLGIQTAGLTVTAANRRAFEWYQRLGFKIRKEFGAYVWQR